MAARASSTVPLLRLSSIHKSLRCIASSSSRSGTFHATISIPHHAHLFTLSSSPRFQSPRPVTKRIPIALDSSPYSKTATTNHKFSSTSSTHNDNHAMAPLTQALIDVAKNRRSYHVLGRNSPVPDSEVIDLVHQAILHLPSSFNTQSTRIVVAMHGDHEKVWDIVFDAFKGLIAKGSVTQELFDNQTKPKLDLFKGAYGTILFYEDPAHIKPYSEKFPFIGDKFSQWAEHTNAIHQWFIWAGLESLGFGANLQHYNPIIDEDLAKAFDVPPEWQLKAQLVFGSIEAPYKEKTYLPVEERVKVFGAQ